MAHAYQLGGEDPTDTSIADIRQQVALELDPYERVLPEQQIAIQQMSADPLTDRPEHLRALYRFSEAKHSRDGITTVATTLLKSLPIAWGVVEYHQCPHDLGADQQGPCPDWTREATVGTPPEGI
jgi:hypothetical protein